MALEWKLLGPPRVEARRVKLNGNAEISGLRGILTCQAMLKKVLVSENYFAHFLCPSMSLEAAQKKSLP